MVVEFGWYGSPDSAEENPKKQAARTLGARACGWKGRVPGILQRVHAHALCKRSRRIAGPGGQGRGRAEDSGCEPKHRRRARMPGRRRGLPERQQVDSRDRVHATREKLLENPLSGMHSWPAVERSVTFNFLFGSSQFRFR